MSKDSKEFGEIKNILNRELENDLDNYSYFHAGEFVNSPNQSGFFKRDTNWYSYEIDEKNFCTFSGPFSKTGIIHVCGLMLHAINQLQEYKFTKEEEKYYINNNFHSLQEIDQYCKESR